MNHIFAIIFLSLHTLVNSYTIYPVPQKQELSGKCSSLSVEATVVASPGIDGVTVSRALGILSEHGISAIISDKPSRDRSNILLGVNGDGSQADRSVTRSGLDRSLFSLDKYDRHILELGSDRSGNARVTILGENSDAVFCGLASLEQMLDGGLTDLPEVVLYDYADIRDRGIIEGYYGMPYSAEVTKDLFRFMARYKMNTYMYGAKSDPYHSRFWADPYPDTITAEQEHIGYLTRDMLRDITDVARANKVNFIWAIHPGTAFTDPEDTDVNRRIMQKFENMYELGVRQFGLFVDDCGVPEDDASLKLGADRLTELQGLIDARGDIKPLHFVPQLYAYTWVERPVAERFFKSLSPVPDKVSIYITGNAIWTVPNNNDLTTVKNMLGKPVSWWWNYPCNDNDMTKLFTMDMYSNFRDEAHVDNLSRLEVLDNARTINVNPMQQGEISKITLFSIADYTWNNAAYNNELSYRAAIPAVTGPDYAETFRFLAPFLRYYDHDALDYMVKGYKRSVSKGQPYTKDILGTLDAVCNACNKIKGMADSDDQSLRLFYQDMKPWVLKLEAMAGEAAALIRGEHPEPVDYKHNPDFKFEVLNGMGEGISSYVKTAQPSDEVLRPFIEWLRLQ